MTQHVVLFMGDCDDIPVAVCDRRDEAFALAKEIGYPARVKGSLADEIAVFVDPMPFE